MKRSLYKSNYFSFLIPPRPWSASEFALLSVDLANIKRARLETTHICCSRPYTLCGIKLWLTYREIPEKVNTVCVSALSQILLFFILYLALLSAYYWALPKYFYSKLHFHCTVILSHRFAESLPPFWLETFMSPKEPAFLFLHKVSLWC